MVCLMETKDSLVNVVEMWGPCYVMRFDRYPENFFFLICRSFFCVCLSVF